MDPYEDDIERLAAAGLQSARYMFRDKKDMRTKVAKKTRQYKVLLERVGWDFVATFGEVKMRGPDQGLGPIPASKK